MIPAAFEYLAPRTLDEAIEALKSHGEDAKLLAGGHSLLPLMRLRLAMPKILVDLSRIPGLGGIREEDDRILIGALTTHYEIESSPILREKCPLLPETAKAIGDVQVRNRGTIGGSLAHADPAADLPAAILALGAELRLKGLEGERSVKAQDFFHGLMTTAIQPSEVLTSIRVPIVSGRSGAAYLKMPQKASGFAIVGVAVWVRMEGGVCQNLGIGVTGLGARPFRATRVEERLRGRKLGSAAVEEASAQASAGVDALEDIHASADFRAHLARVFTARAIEAAAEKAS